MEKINDYFYCDGSVVTERITSRVFDDDFRERLLRVIHKKNEIIKTVSQKIKVHLDKDVFETEIPNMLGNRDVSVIASQNIIQFPVTSLPLYNMFNFSQRSLNAFINIATENLEEILSYTKLENDSLLKPKEELEKEKMHPIWDYDEISPRLIPEENIKKVLDEFLKIFDTDYNEKYITSVCIPVFKIYKGAVCNDGDSYDPLSLFNIIMYYVNHSLNINDPDSDVFVDDESYWYYNTKDIKKDNGYTAYIVFNIKVEDLFYTDMRTSILDRQYLESGFKEFIEKIVKNFLYNCVLIDFYDIKSRWAYLTPYEIYKTLGAREIFNIIYPNGCYKIDDKVLHFILDTLQTPTGTYTNILDRKYSEVEKFIKEVEVVKHGFPHLYNDYLEACYRLYSNIIK